MPSLPSRNKTLVIAAKIHTETDIKVYWSFPNLLDFLTLSHLFFIYFLLVFVFSVSYFCFYDSREMILVRMLRITKESACNHDYGL